MGWRIRRRPVGSLVGRSFRARGPAARPKAGRGDVRAAILALLREGPLNGYQIMSEIEERSNGAWRPSPARSIRRYPSSRMKA